MEETGVSPCILILMSDNMTDTQEIIVGAAQTRVTERTAALVELLRRDYFDALVGGETGSAEEYAEWVRRVVSGEG